MTWTVNVLHWYMLILMKMVYILRHRFALMWDSPLASDELTTCWSDVEESVVLQQATITLIFTSNPWSFILKIQEKYFTSQHNTLFIWNSNMHVRIVMMMASCGSEQMEIFIQFTESLEVRSQSSVDNAFGIMDGIITCGIYSVFIQHSISSIIPMDGEHGFR